MTTYPDPVFTAIDEFRPHGEALRAAYIAQDDKLIALASPPVFDRLRRIYQMEPQTPAGLVALMNLLEEWDGDHLNLNDPDNPDVLDDGERGLIAIFHYAKRMLEQMQ